MELYLVRHGKTDWNEQKRLQGNIDIHLNQAGKDSARELGKKLKDIEFDKIYSSPLSRALETAQLICASRNIPIITDERLREISFGEYEGITYEEWTNPSSPYRFFFNEDVTKYNPPAKGESIDSLCARTKDFIQSEIEVLQGKCQRIMIVGHGALLAATLCYLENHGKEKFWAGGLKGNCGLVKFNFDGKKFTRLED
ncbi:MAG: histidine phosphatase family protein [Treponema sp.]|nr:histidine phosphatase family protein [Treponema sp.]